MGSDLDIWLPRYSGSLVLGVLGKRLPWEVVPYLIALYIRYLLLSLLISGLLSVLLPLSFLPILPAFTNFLGSLWRFRLGFGSLKIKLYKLFFLSSFELYNRPSSSRLYKVGHFGTSVFAPRLVFLYIQRSSQLSLLRTIFLGTRHIR